jgi:hypothetical protein
MLFLSLALKGFLALVFFVIVRLIASCVWHLIPDSTLRNVLFKERYS